MNMHFQKLILCILASLFGLFLLGNFYTHSTAAPLTDGIPPFPNTVEVKMYELRSDGSKTDTLCTPASTNYGCTAFCNTPNNTQCSPHIYPVKNYPYTTSTLSVPVETYYLLDVVSTEMTPTFDGYGQQSALHAQAIAARSYMGWHINNSTTYNNSISFQAYVPYKFDSLNPSAVPLEPNTTDPCAAGSLNALQQKVCAAVASRYYIARAEDNPNKRPAFAEFSSDAYLRTATGDHGYLIKVEDPISYDPAILDIISVSNAHQRGMSQNGANRWAWGNSSRLGGGAPWPVRWTDYRQILAHYYTGIDFLNDSVSTGSTTDGNKIAPDDRWNPLDYRLEDDSDVPQEMALGQEYRIKFRIQNTSTTDWSAGEITLGFTLLFVLITAPKNCKNVQLRIRVSPEHGYGE